MVKVININSLSFTGTTWINALLGANKNSIAVGPPDRVLKILVNNTDDELCRIHKEECDFWNTFKNNFDKNKNFYLQLAKYANVENIIINNPIIGGMAEKQLSNSEIIVKTINIVRDGRAICASYLRQYPESDTLDVINDWFLPSASNFYFNSDDQDILCMRYENILDDTFGALQKIGKFVDIKYTNDSLQFWNYEQHLTAGNAGVFNTIRFFENPDQISFKDAKYIKEQVELMKKNPSKAFKKERWKNEFSKREFFLFDYFAGSINEKWGYDRDGFNTSELDRFLSELNAKNEQQVIKNKVNSHNEQLVNEFRNDQSCIIKMKQCLLKLLRKVYRKIKFEKNK